MGDVIEFPTRNPDPDLQALEEARWAWIQAHVRADLPEHVRNEQLAIAWSMRHRFDCHLDLKNLKKGPAT